MFVYIILKANYGEHWRSLKISSDEGKDVTIAAATSQRRSQDEVYGYLGFPATCPLLYLTSGELIRLIIDETNWKHFKPYFSASKEIVKTKLDEIGNVRNALAHFRPLRAEDVSLVKQNAMHVLPKVEQCLQEVLKCEDAVPTNLDEPWYKSLSVIGSDLCALRFSQSHDATWVKIHLRYACRTIQVEKVASFLRNYRITTVRTAAILDLQPVIRNAVIFVNESIPFFRIVKDEDPKFSKTITLTFAKKTLAEKHTEIRIAIVTLLEKLNQETELVKNDHLARGELIYAISASARQTTSENKPGQWSIDVPALREREDLTDAPEYFGSLESMSVPDFITDSPRFAWMPVDVADYGIPF